MALQTTGWDPITYPEIRAGIVTLWKGAFGDNADTDPNTPDGLLINIIAMSLTLAFDVDTLLWANSYFRSATGISLDRILDLFRKPREKAEKSTGFAVFFGAPSAAIPAATVVVTADAAENRFGTDAAAAIGADDNSDTWVTRILAAEAGVTYLAQVNAEVPSSYVALGGDDVADIAAGLRDDINNDGFATAALAGVDSDGAALLVVDIIGGPGNHTVSDIGGAGPVIDGFEAVRAAITALDAGALAASAGTLQTIATPIGGVEGVTNDADATIGQAEESDDAYRARHLQTLFSNSARTDGGMQAAVAALPGVEENSVVSNRSQDPVDVDNRPIGSVENIVLKTTSNPAADVDIANAIARQIPAGIRPYGLRSFGLGTTIDGEIIEVFATDTVELYLHLEVTITAGEGFPSGNLESAVAEAIASYFDAGLVVTSEGVFTDTSAKLTTGKDWTIVATATPINIVTGNAVTNLLVESDLTANPGDSPSFSPVNQVASKREIIRVDASRIAVTIS
jgi:hypothetical protein